MSPDPHNSPLPGKGIEASPAEPPFTRAARGEGEPRPEVLHHNLNLTPRHVATLTPDGRAAVPGRAEEERRAGVGARFQRVQEAIDRDGAQPADLSKLQRDFDDARHNRR